MSELNIYHGFLCNNANFEEKLTFQIKIDTRNLTKFDMSTQKSQEFVL